MRLPFRAKTTKKNRQKDLPGVRARWKAAHHTQSDSLSELVHTALSWCLSLSGVACPCAFSIAFATWAVSMALMHEEGLCQAVRVGRNWRSKGESEAHLTKSDLREDMKEGGVLWMERCSGVTGNREMNSYCFLKSISNTISSVIPSWFPVMEVGEPLLCDHIVFGLRVEASITQYCEYHVHVQSEGQDHLLGTVCW